MSFRKLVFTKDWNDPLDFPTIETSEAQVRADIQQLHDEARDAINDLIDELGGEGGEGSAAEQLSATPRFTGDSNTIQGQLDATQDAVDVLSPQVSANTSARHTHSNKSVLDGITSALITAWNNAVTWVTTNGSNVLSHLSDTVKHITSAERSTWNAKQNAISDLATIRSGAALGATAVQPAELADYVEEPPEEGTPGYVLATDGEGGRYWKAAGGGGGGTGDYPDLTNKPRINGVELIGDKTGDDLGFPTEEETEAAIDAVVSAHNSDSSAHSGLFNALSSIYAAISHNHSAANITSGTLPVSRGGTGKSTLPEGAVIADGANDFTSRAITNQTSGTVAASTNLITANSLRAHVAATKMFYVGDDEPTNTNLLWIDTTPGTGGLKYYKNATVKWVTVPVRWS